MIKEVLRYHVEIKEVNSLQGSAAKEMTGEEEDGGILEIFKKMMGFLINLVDVLI